MDLRTTRLILWTLGGLFAAAAAATTVWLGQPVTVSGSGSMTGAAASAGAQVGPGGGLPPLSDFQPLWGMDLRRPLVDVAAPSAGPAVSTPTATDQPPGIRLLGTIIEPGHSMAVFAGSVGLKVVGDEASGAKVEAIEADSVTLSYDGRTLRVPIDKPPGTSSEPAAARPGADSGTVAGAAPGPETDPAAGPASAAAANGAASAPVLVPAPDYEVPR